MDADHYDCLCVFFLSNVFPDRHTLDPFLFGPGFGCKLSPRNGVQLSYHLHAKLTSWSAEEIYMQISR